MMYTVPKTIESDLLQQLECLFDSDDMPSEFTLAGLARDATKLMKVDAAHGHSVMAGIHALRWDPELVEYHARNAITLDGNYMLQRNVAINLRQVGLVDRAAEHMRIASQLAPTDIQLQGDAIEFLLMAGEFVEAADMARKCQARGIDFGESVFDPILALDELQASGVPESRVKLEIAQAYQVLLEQRKRPRGFGFKLERDPDGDLTMVLSLQMFGDYTDEMRLESAFSHKLGDDAEWDPCKLSIEFEGKRNDACHPD